MGGHPTPDGALTVTRLEAFMVYVMTVADHQPPTRLVELVGERLDLGSDLSLPRDGQHRPGAVADNLIQQRPTLGHSVSSFDPFSSWTTLSMGAPSRAGASTPTPIGHAAEPSR